MGQKKEKKKKNRKDTYGVPDTLTTHREFFFSKRGLGTP
jgi:hypothetical protein